MSGLLLVEFAVMHRFHRAVSFPFLQGRARRAQIPCTWVRFGVPAESQAEEHESGASLTHEDCAKLAEFADETRPDFVIFSHAPAPSLVRTLLASAPGAAYVYVAQGVAEHSDAVEVDGGCVRPLTTELKDSILGSQSSEVYWEDEPDYAWVAGNRAATEMDVLPFIYCGVECTYNRSYKGNSFFEASDLVDCDRDGGCAFCRRPPNDTRSMPDLIPTLKRQLRQLRATCPTFGRRQRIRLVGEPVMEHILEVADAILEAQFAPADFLLDSRADTLVRKAPQLQDALAKVNATGHSFQMCLIGIENFCTAELNRYNKGLDATTNLRAARTLFELESKFPGTFAFREHGGLSLITFNPWTTPEQLDLNLTVVELLGLEQVAGKLFNGRLRLYKGLPLEHKARREGLVTESYNDALLDTARHAFYEQETPWRFADPLMEPINRILSRLRLNNVPAKLDALTCLVQETENLAYSKGQTAAGFGHLVVDTGIALASTTGVPTPEHLLDTLAQRLEQGRKAPKGEGWTLAEGAAKDITSIDRGSLALEDVLKSKPVSKKEPLRADEMSVWLGNKVYPNAKGRKRNWSHESPEEVWELFFGVNEADVDRAILLTELLERRDIEDHVRAAANIEVGQLLGYPTCCAAAFAKEPSPIQATYFFATVARRVETPGEVAFTLHPASAMVDHIPCSLTCEPSVAHSKWTLEAYHWNRFEKEAAMRSWQNPWFLMHSMQRNFIEVIPEAEPSGRCKYRAGRCSGEGPDIEAVQAGDEWVMDEETLLILKQGRPIYSLSGRAFLWWYKRPFQARFWKEILDFRRTILPLQEIREVRQTPKESAVLTPKLGFLMRMLLWQKGQQQAFAGFGIASVETTSQGQLRVRLVSSSEGITLVVAEREPGTKSLFNVGPFAISYLKETPLESPTQWQGARTFVAELQSALQRLAPSRK